MKKKEIEKAKKLGLDMEHYTMKGEGKVNLSNDQEIIYLCECGKYQHTNKSKYCSECGRKIHRNRENALAKQIEELLEQWRIENSEV